MKSRHGDTLREESVERRQRGALVHGGKTTTAALGSPREAGLARRACGRKLSEPKRNGGEKKREQRKKPV
jgi:hypothetical protein